MSLITISNQVLTVAVDSRGAMLHSVVKDGVEYLWQGDPAYWEQRDLNLFPWVGRLKDGKYLFRGLEYPMPIHGFCVGADFQVTERSRDSLCLTLRDGEETRQQYPFPFRFHVIYRLEGSSLVKTCKVENTGSSEMYFGLGSHPGFQVPLGGEGAFSDWYLEFPEACSPVRVDFDQTSCLVSGKEEPCPLENGRRIPLRHSLFDRDALVLKGTPPRVCLRSGKSSRSVTVDFPQMNYIGFWHRPKTDAPYVCIEPWLSLPGRHGQTEDLARQEHLIRLPAGSVYENNVTITLT